jgi:hypothetical protein
MRALKLAVQRITLAASVKVTAAVAAIIATKTIVALIGVVSS